MRYNLRVSLTDILEFMKHRSRHCFLRLILCCLCLTSLPLSAAQLSGLYAAAVPVTGQTQQERRSAIRQAFAEVLVKVTGNRQATVQPSLQQALQRSLYYVQQFRYRPAPALAPGDGQEVTPPAQELWVSFDARAVNQLLYDSAVPVWGRARPATLIWLAVEDQGRRELVGADTRAELQVALEQEARRRGLPLFFPLLDLEDQRQLHFADIWGNFGDAILQASRRYHSEAVLAGRLHHRADGQWESRWTLYLNEAAAQWSTQGATALEVLAAGVDGATTRLAARYAQRINNGVTGNRVMITVRDVNTLNDYARTLKYLQSLDLVRRVQIVSVSPSQLVFRISIRGSRQGLVQVIAFGGTLAALGSEPGAPPRVVAAGATSSPAPPGLSYRLLP